MNITKRKFEISLSRNFIEKMFKLIFNYEKKEAVKTNMIADTGSGIYGQTNRKEIEYIHKKVIKNGWKKNVIKKC